MWIGAACKMRSAMVCLMHVPLNRKTCKTSGLCRQCIEAEKEQREHRSTVSVFPEILIAIQHCIANCHVTGMSNYTGTALYGSKSRTEIFLWLESLFVFVAGLQIRDSMNVRLD